MKSRTHVSDLAAVIILSVSASAQSLQFTANQPSLIEDLSFLSVRQAAIHFDAPPQSHCDRALEAKA
jgi:hypothetical protein